MKVWLVIDENEPDFNYVWFSKSQAIDYAQHTAKVCAQGHNLTMQVLTEETPTGTVVSLQLLRKNQPRVDPTNAWRTVRNWYINEKKVRGDLVTALGELAE